MFAQCVLDTEMLFAHSGLCWGEVGSLGDLSRVINGAT